MTRAKKRKKKNARRSHQLSEHGKMAELLLPPVPENCPPYTRTYFESYRSKLFVACKNRHHRNCPQTSDQGHEHLYCKCPCHRKNLTRYQQRKLYAQMIEQEQRTRPRRVAVVRGADGKMRVAQPKPVGSRGQQKHFRYVKAPAAAVPSGIMFAVHSAIASMKQGTVAEVSAVAISKFNLDKQTGQDPVNQTSIMLHRLLKVGVVEVL